MHKIVSTFVISLLFCLPLDVLAAPASPFSLKDYRSPTQTVSLSEFKGKVVYLDFWASWCKPCRSSFPWMNEMHNKYANKGLEVISINLDEQMQSVAKFLHSYPASFRVLLDPEGNVASDYQLVGMPSSYLIDRQGQLRKTHTGFFLKKTDAYEQEIITLLSE